jgi:transposase
MCPLDYYTHMRNCKDKRLLRYHLIVYAREHGIKPAARAFKTTPKTVRKWLFRWQPGSLRGLEDRSKAPKSRKCQIPPTQRRKAIELKKRLRGFGAERIKRDYGLSISEKAIRRIWKEEGLLRRKRRKHRTKQDLREMKARWRLFEQTEIDVKVLFDIPEYWPQMKRHRLPKYQYTAREVVSGLMFLGYADECNLTNSTLFVQVILDHLRSCGADLKDSRIQTDNGSEFIGPWCNTHTSSFTQAVEAVEGLSHRTIPPAAHTFQADVETAHRLIEDEFYEVEEFPSREAFMAKASTYALWFNAARKNSYKGLKTPWQIAHAREPTLKPQLAALTAIDLDQIMKIKLANSTLRGYDLVQYPSTIPIPLRCKINNSWHGRKQLIQDNYNPQ